MDLEKKFSFKLKEYFKENFKLLFLTKMHIIIVTKEDKVYEFERNLKTLIEYNKYNNIFIESKILNELCFKKIIDFKNGSDHLIARTIDGKVYCWGCNEFGVLGNGKNGSQLYKPQLNEYLSDKNIVDICCGERHTIVLTNSGEVYAWGHNEWGQIGSGTSGERECQLIPIKINGFNEEKVTMISCGSDHSIALTKSGRAYSWGNNEFGQSGHNHTNDVIKPSIVPLDDEVLIMKISCGRNHSLLLSRDGHIYWFGWYGFETKIAPKKLTINRNKFIDIGSHSLHCISFGQSISGIYYIWGHCIEEDIREPKETKFKSIDDIFDHYLGITYNAIERYIFFKIKLLENGKYSKEFREVEKLGEGSFGQVFRVKNLKHTSSEFAIKKIKFTIDKENILFKELENFFIINKCETDATNILALHEIWIESNSKLENKSDETFTLHISMELCEKTLEEAIEELQSHSHLFNNGILTHLGYYIACKLFIKILEGVNYLHTRKSQILHMDLHPGNILLKKTHFGQIEVKIGDFGLAKICEFAKISQKITSKRVSKRSNYKSSNVLSSGSYSTRDDIYSLGIIMKELFSIDTNRLSLFTFY
jgi:alpha-tubulin suppressor-like RCC1 family protein